MRKETHYIVLPQTGVARWAVSAGPTPDGSSELHGGFETQQEAESYRDELRKEFSDYTYVEVVEVKLVRP